MKRITSLLVCLMLFSFTALFAQDILIKGTVTGDDGDPLPGVSVVVKGTRIGMATDVNGVYSLEVPQDAILVFSAVGMKSQEIAVAGQSVIDVVIESDVLGLDEVVVTALGISRERKSLGYSVQTVTSEDISRAANHDLQTNLSGKIAGVDVRQSSGMPGAPAQIFIRGARSFSGDNTPLYVVDGMPISSGNDYSSNVTGAAFSNRAIDIDPNNIESINVLKGQAAAALYGLRASNGVIIITTKKGSKVGRPVVAISSSVVFDNIARLPEVQQTYAQGSGGNYALANSFSWGPKLETLPDHATFGGNTRGQQGKYFNSYKNEWVDPIPYNNPENFYDKNGYTFNNNINISNSTTNGSYSVGFGSTNQTGLIRNTGMQRYSGSFAGDFNLTKKWKTGFSGNYSDTDVDKLPSGNDSYLFTVYGSPPSFDLMGTPFHQEGTDGDYRQISYRRGAVGNNPLWILENNKFTEKTKRFFGSTFVEYNPIKQINLKYQIGIDNYTTDYAQYQEMGTGSLPTAGQYPTPENPVYGYVAPTGGVIDHYGLTRRVINSLATATITHQFSDLIGANLVLGNEVDQNTSEFYSSYGSSFTTPGWDNLDNTNIQQSAYDEYARRTVGFFGNLNLDLSNMLFFNGTIRHDIVSSMPRDNRGFTYPSASLSFIFTELGALKDINILPFGKARISYAEVGQAAQTYYANPYFVTGGASSGFLDYGIVYPWRDLTGYKYSNTLYDPALTPQNTQTIEFGLDLRFVNNRIGLDYTFFNQTASDQIFPVPLAGSTGYSQLVKNAGEMSSIGHEIVLYLTPVKADKFSWDITTNFTKINNEVVSLAEGVESIFLGGYVTPNIRASAGDSYPAIYGDQFKKDEQGRILVDEDPNSPNYGMPMSGDFGKIGDVSPDFILGINNRFTILKHFSLFAQLDWKKGGQMYSGSNRLMDLYGTSKRSEDREGEFIYAGYLSNGEPNNITRGGTGDEGAFQHMYTNVLDNIDENAIYSTSFVKLRELGISVNIPNNLITRIGLQKAAIGFVARNILLSSDLPYFDPESSQGQGNMQGAMDYMSLPQTTSYGFNLNLEF